MSKKANLLIVDDHNLIRDGYKAMLGSFEDLHVVGECENGLEALTFLENNEVDIVLMDIKMPIMDGIECTQKIKEQYPETKVLAITMQDEEEHIRTMMVSGASGYILKNAGYTVLLNAIKTILKGDIFYSEQVTKIVMNDLSKVETKVINQEEDVFLTEREKEVLKLIVEEKSNSEISDQLFISVRTVDAHRRNLLQKTGVKNAVGLTKYALKYGIVSL